MALRWEKLDGRVAAIILDEPEVRNALTAETREALRTVLAAVTADEGVDALIIAGAGGNFCAGGDIRTMGETDAAAIGNRMADVAETALALAAFPRPVIAAVDGHAAGAGVSLACLCDIVVADGATQFTFSHLRMALGPDWGLSHTLPARVGEALARRLIISGARIDGAEAHRIGLVDILAAEGEVAEAARVAARELAGGPRRAIGAVKAMMSDFEALRAALVHEGNVQRGRFPAPEHQEAAAAFREKRNPDFTKGKG